MYLLLTKKSFYSLISKQQIEPAILGLCNNLYKVARQRPSINLRFFKSLFHLFPIDIMVIPSYVSNYKVFITIHTDVVIGLLPPSARIWKLLKLFQPRKCSNWTCCQINWSRRLRKLRAMLSFQGLLSGIFNKFAASVFPPRPR